jgi:hypothetical protein
VNPLPTVTISQPLYSVCPGTSLNITANGATTYTWFPSGFSGNPFSVTANSNGTYTVLGKSAAGCTANATATVFIKPAPALTYNTFSITCANLGSATVTASGGIGPFYYSWNP